MRGTLLLAGLLLATPLGLAGTAAADCAFGATPVGGFYQYCTPVYTESPSCANNFLGSFSAANPVVDYATGSVTASGHAWQNDCGVARGTNVRGTVCATAAPVGRACVAGFLVQNEWHSPTYDMTDTRATLILITPAAPLTMVQAGTYYVNGSCTVILTPVTTQSCAPTQGLPPLPDLPHL